MKGQWGIPDFHVGVTSDPSSYNLCSSSNNTSTPVPGHRSESVVLEDAIAARKVQKADREKLRRDRLNEYFLELGRTTDPDRPKNDKVTVLSETIQLLRDLTAEVDQLKAECATLSEESNELLQEKKELQEEKQSLQADVNILSLQNENQQRLLFPWGCVEPPPVVIAPAFSYPFPLSLPPTPYPFFSNQPLGLLPNPYPTFIPYPPPDTHPVPPPSVHPREPGESVGVGTDLELKTPGSFDRGSESSNSSSSSSSGGSSQVSEDSSCSTVSE